VQMNIFQIVEIQNYFDSHYGLRFVTTNSVPTENENENSVIIILKL